MGPLIPIIAGGAGLGALIADKNDIDPLKGALMGASLAGAAGGLAGASLAGGGAAGTTSAGTGSALTAGSLANMGGAGAGAGAGLTAEGLAVGAGKAAIGSGVSTGVAQDMAPDTKTYGGLPDAPDFSQLSQQPMALSTEDLLALKQGSMF